MKTPELWTIEHVLPPADRLGVGLAALLFGAALLGLWEMPERISHDCAVLMREAQMLLDGDIPYCDFIETNPPLTIYMSVVPVALARWLGTPPILTFHLVVLLLLAISSAELYCFLRQGRMGLRAAGRGLVLLAWIGSYFLLDWDNLAGQREHLFVLLYVPYLFLRILRHRGGSVNAWPAALLGVQAGIGASLKPHFLLVALGVEIVLLLATRRWQTLVRPENISLASVVAAYVLHWLFVPPAMREAFFGRWLPLVYHGYHAFDMPTEKMVANLLSPSLALVALAAALIAALRGAQRRARLRHYLLALSTMAGLTVVIVFVQHKGWRYHYIPLYVSGVLCLAVLAATSPRSSAFLQRLAARKFLCVGLVGVLMAVWFTMRRDVMASVPSFAVLRQLIETRSGVDDPVLFVSTSTYPAYPLLLQTGRRSGSRYLACFPLAFYYADAQAPPAGRPIYRRCPEAPAEEQQFLRELAADVRRLRPQLIVVQNDNGWAGLPPGFNTFDYLVYAGWTEDALAGYRKLPGPAGWKVFSRAK